MLVHTLIAALNMALAAFAIGALILAHEFGHFVGARLVGMRVEVFSIGFWKRIVGFKKGHTDYRISLVPLGGYLKVAGESPEESSGEPYEFWSKSPGRRAIFIIGGVTFSFLLGVVLFIVAFAVGVPFPVAQVGGTIPGSPAWRAGLAHGDEIVRIGDKSDLVFNDVTRAVVLGGQDRISLSVLQDGMERHFTLTAEYSEEAGRKQIGILPVREPVVTGLQKVGVEDARCPAQEAGIQLGDRIVSVNGVKIESLTDLHNELLKHPPGELEVGVERKGQSLSFRVLTEPYPSYGIGVSGMSTVVEALQGAGPAEQMGLRVGDRIVAVAGTPVDNVVGLREAIEKTLGEVGFTVQRGEKTLQLAAAIPDAPALEQFLFSVIFETSATLTWVKQDGPAWNCGLRPGDKVIAVAGREVNDWGDIVREIGKAKTGSFEIAWQRGAETFTGRAQAVADTANAPAFLGVEMSQMRTVMKRYGALGAVKKGMADSYAQLAQIVLTIKGFATHEVSTRNLHGIIIIARVSYLAASEGIGMLIYIAAAISIALAFFNILPIPILDGGHLLFLAIEKARGRPLSERAMMIAQSVGLALILMLVVYVTRNDIVSW
ncbi:MAG: RIP metalloprotease RseP [Planctomycetes bacterium]|nr:RIP metalloprotease RseP [Planctomycetota bacterium]